MKVMFLYFLLSVWDDGDLELTRVWLCRWDGEGRKAWDRLGRLGEVPRDP